MTRLTAILTTAVIAATAGYFTHRHWSSVELAGLQATPAVDMQGEPLIGRKRPDYTLGSIDGSIVSASRFDGQVVVLNFWATWCAPCREEMPMLMDLRAQNRERGLEIVGIALDDVARAREFVAELGVEYPILAGSTDVMAMVRLYGNTTGVLPYTVLIDREGIVRWTRLGVLNAATLESEIRALMDDT